jgi:hypothetical protein
MKTFILIKFLDGSIKLIKSYKGKDDYKSMKKCFNYITEVDKAKDLKIDYMDICEVIK